jgi:putative ABC transport system permease protein
MSDNTTAGLLTQRLLGPQALFYFYRRRLRAHRVQELLAGVGIAAAVALVLAAGISQNSIAGSTQRLVRAVTGPASVQLRARGQSGFDESLLGKVEALPGVRRAAPLLERSLHVIGPHGKSAEVYIAGTDVSLAVLNGLGKTLPLGALSSGRVGLSSASARVLGVTRHNPGQVTLLVGGIRRTVAVSAILGSETAGALSGALVGVMPLSTMQQLLGEPHRVTRILVQPSPGAKGRVIKELGAIAGEKLIVGGVGEDVAQLRQALRPSIQASDLFAVIGALLGFLFAFNAILLTVPERRQMIADLRMSGTRRSAIVQLTSFQALCLGTAASGVGLMVGYALSRWVFHQSTSYLQEAFTISGGTLVSTRGVLAAGLGGIVATWLASSLPLLDLRRRSLDGIYLHTGVPGNALTARPRIWLFALALALLVLASILYTMVPSDALVASIALALATVLVVPVVFAFVLASARALSERAPRLSTLAIALGGVQGTTFRALALAATGAVALFGSVALGGARSDLLSGIHGFARSYAADAPIWIAEPDDNQATRQLVDAGVAHRLSELPGVASVQRFQGAFLTVGSRRVWVIARPPGAARHVLGTQALGGPHEARLADARLAEGGWVALSRQIADEHGTAVGGTFTLPTPSGEVRFRIAALTSNLAWSPGAVFMADRDFARLWHTSAPSALAVQTTSGADSERVIRDIRMKLPRNSGLEVTDARTREQKIDHLTNEGLSQLGLISTLLLLAAILALAAALASSINQRRVPLAGLRLAGAPPARLRRILLTEAALMLAAGCITGALAGVYGQFIIDAYLRHVTGFPVANAGASARPVEILAVVLSAALALVALPGWRASRVSPVLALVEE